MNNYIFPNLTLLFFITSVCLLAKLILNYVNSSNNCNPYEELQYEDDIELGNVYYDNRGSLRGLFNEDFSRSTRFRFPFGQQKAMELAKGSTDDNMVFPLRYSHRFPQITNSHPDDYSNKPTKIDVLFQTENPLKVISAHVQAMDLWNQKDNDHLWSFEDFTPKAVELYTQHQTEFLFNVLTILNLHEKYGQLIHEWNSITTKKIAKQMKINPTYLNVYTQREFSEMLYQLRNLHRRFYQQVKSPFFSDGNEEGDDVSSTATVGMIYVFLNDFIDQLQEGTFLKSDTFSSDMKNLFDVVTKMEQISADPIQQQQPSEETNNLQLYFSPVDVENSMEQIRPGVQHYLKVRQHDIFDKDYMMKIFHMIHANLKL